MASTTDRQPTTTPATDAQPYGIRHCQPGPTHPTWARPGDAVLPLRHARPGAASPTSRRQAPLRPPLSHPPWGPPNTATDSWAPPYHGGTQGHGGTRRRLAHTPVTTSCTSGCCNPPGYTSTPSPPTTARHYPCAAPAPLHTSAWCRPTTPPQARTPPTPQPQRAATPGSGSTTAPCGRITIGSWRSSSRAHKAMSKKPIQLWGLETSPWGVPRSRRKVQGVSSEGRSLNPAALERAQVDSAHGERIAVRPSISMAASQWAVTVGTPSRLQLISIAPRETESKARRISQLEE